MLENISNLFLVYYFRKFSNVEEEPIQKKKKSTFAEEPQRHILTYDDHEDDSNVAEHRQIDGKRYI